MHFTPTRFKWYKWLLPSESKQGGDSPFLDVLSMIPRASPFPFLSLSGIVIQKETPDLKEKAAFENDISVRRSLLRRHHLCFPNFPLAVNICGLRFLLVSQRLPLSCVTSQMSMSNAMKREGGPSTKSRKQRPNKSAPNMCRKVVFSSGRFDAWAFFSIHFPGRDSRLTNTHDQQ